MEMLKVHLRKGEEQGANLWELSVNKCWKSRKADSRAGDKPLPEAGQVADQKAHLLSQWAAPKVKLSPKIHWKNSEPS
jgi:hypothetical protein